MWFVASSDTGGDGEVLSSVMLNTASPTEVLRGLRGDSRALVEFRATQRGDAVPPLEDTNKFLASTATGAEVIFSLRSSASLPLEFLRSTISCDAQVPVEVRSSTRGDTAVSLEALSTRFFDTGFRTEGLLSARGDAVVPAEYASDFSADQAPCLEDAASLASDAVPGLEALAQLASDAAVPTEFLGGFVVVGDSPVQLEFLSTQVGDVGMSVEFSTSVFFSNSILQTEVLSGLRRGEDAPTEIVKSSRGDASVHLEDNIVLVSDAALETEVKSRQISDSAGLLEVESDVAAFGAEGAAPLEFGLGVSANLAVPTEDILSVVRSVYGRVEYLSRQIADSVPQSEVLASGRTAGTSSPVEVLKSVAGDARASVEDAALQLGDSAAQVEVESDVAVSGIDGVAQLEFTAGVDRREAPRAEILGGVQRDVSVAAEVLADQAADFTPNLDSSLTAYAADSGVPVEYTNLVRSDVTIPIAWGGSVGVFTGVPAESSALFLSNTAALSDYAGQLSSDTGLPIQTIFGVIADAMSGVEWESTVSAAGADGVAQVEFTVTVMSASGVPVSVKTFNLGRMTRNQLYSALSAGIDTISGF